MHKFFELIITSQIVCLLVFLVRMLFDLCSIRIYNFNFIRSIVRVRGLDCMAISSIRLIRSIVIRPFRSFRMVGVIAILAFRCHCHLLHTLIGEHLFYSSRRYWYLIICNSCIKLDNYTYFKNH